MISSVEHFRAAIDALTASDASTSFFLLRYLARMLEFGLDYFVPTKKNSQINWSPWTSLSILEELMSGILLKDLPDFEVPGAPPMDMLVTESISGTRLIQLLEGIDCQEFFPRQPEFSTYDEFVQRRLISRLTGHGLSPTNHLGENTVNIKQCHTSTLDKDGPDVPINFPSWSVMCVQLDGSIGQEPILLQCGDVMGLQLSSSVGDIVPRTWFEELLRQCMGLRNKLIERSAKMYRIISSSREKERRIREIESLVKEKVHRQYAKKHPKHRQKDILHTKGARKKKRVNESIVDAQHANEEIEMPRRCNTFLDGGSCGSPSLKVCRRSKRLMRK
ncbi:hypothetical protein ACH5RR_002899 [Cinchona calisaya]|uniref:Uncharacterized protein n=1 Tax=Cinchona calisaya TaxID=153742 RepID=A0ABD3ATL7_9GENT